MILCCHHCVAPMRHPGCHDHCDIYQKAKKSMMLKKRLRINVYEQNTIILVANSNALLVTTNEPDLKRIIK